MTASTYTLVSGSTFTGKGQAALVYEILQAGDGQPKTVKEIADLLDVNPAFKTRQTATRIAAYYVCVFKKAGLVTAGAVEIPLATNENDNDVHEPE